MKNHNVDSLEEKKFNSFFEDEKFQKSKNLFQDILVKTEEISHFFESYYQLEILKFAIFGINTIYNHYKNIYSELNITIPPHFKKDNNFSHIEHLYININRYSLPSFIRNIYKTFELTEKLISCFSEQEVTDAFNLLEIKSKYKPTLYPHFIDNVIEKENISYLREYINSKDFLDKINSNPFKGHNIKDFLISIIYFSMHCKILIGHNTSLIPVNDVKILNHIRSELKGFSFPLKERTTDLIYTFKIDINLKNRPIEFMSIKSAINKFLKTTNNILLLIENSLQNSDIPTYSLKFIYNDKEKSFTFSINNIKILYKNNSSMSNVNLAFINRKVTTEILYLEILNVLDSSNRNFEYFHRCFGMKLYFFNLLKTLKIHCSFSFFIENPKNSNLIKIDRNIFYAFTNYFPIHKIFILSKFNFSKGQFFEFSNSMDSLYNYIISCSIFQDFIKDLKIRNNEGIISNYMKVTPFDEMFKNNYFYDYSNNSVEYDPLYSPVPIPFLMLNKLKSNIFSKHTALNGFKKYLIQICIYFYFRDNTYLFLIEKSKKSNDFILNLDTFFDSFSLLPQIYHKTFTDGQYVNYYQLIKNFLNSLDIELEKKDNLINCFDLLYNSSGSYDKVKKHMIEKHHEEIVIKMPKQELNNFNISLINLLYLFCFLGIEEFFSFLIKKDSKIKLSFEEIYFQNQGNKIFVKLKNINNSKYQDIEELKENLLVISYKNNQLKKSVLEAHNSYLPSKNIGNNENKKIFSSNKKIIIQLLKNNISLEVPLKDFKISKIEK